MISTVLGDRENIVCIEGYKHSENNPNKYINLIELT